MKIARNVQFEIKAGQGKEFNRIMHADVLPLLKKQEGFSEELTMMHQDKGVAISVWKDQACADAYVKLTYPQVLEKLNPLLVGAPRVQTYDVTASQLAV
jgi:quinol monooxygenase YgiN